MKTKYLYVKNQVKSKILQGYYQPHQKISSETLLMKEFKVSRHTIRKAIDELVLDGWVYKKQGAGTFCSEYSLTESNSFQRIKNIAVITTYLSEYIFPCIIRGAESYLSANGYQVTVFSTDNNSEKERKYLDLVLSQQFDGLIIEPTKSAFPNPNINYYLNIERMGLPYVMLNSNYEELQASHLMIDDEEGGFKQTAHLIEQGHQHIIGFFKNDDAQGPKRMKGFIKAHRAADLSISPQNIITYTTENKETLPKEILQKKLIDASAFPTAIVCYNDQLALSLLDVLREMQMSVPEDISLIGFDDSILSTVSEVKLTTIKHPQAQLGVDAGKMIHRLIEEKADTRKKNNLLSLIYTPELIIRNSTRKISNEPAPSPSSGRLQEES